MPPSTDRPSLAPRIAIVGGGISGLSAAQYLQQQFPECEYQVIESSPVWGGVLQTHRRDGFLIERSADSFLDTPDQPWASQLMTELGMQDELIPTDKRFRRARVLHDGKLFDIPAGFQLMVPSRIGPILKSRLLSWSGKARLLSERFVPRRQDEQEETLAHFATRRLGKQAYQRLVQPLVSGIYTADPEKLCMQAALPRFSRWEAEFGSITAGLRAQMRSRPPTSSNRDGHRAVDATSGARYAEFRSLRDGMGSLITRLVAGLRQDGLRLDTVVERIGQAKDHTWQVISQRGDASSFDAVIIATAPHVAAKLLEPVDAQLRTLLDGIESASVAIVSLGLHRNQLESPLECFGAVVPLIEHRDIVAASFSSVKFPGRAPPEHELVRVFIGGACHADLLQNDDSALIEIACRELREIIGMAGEPVITDVARWSARTPQYHIGHRLRVETIRNRLSTLAGLELAGNAMDGIGVPHCIHSGQQAASRVIDALRR